MKKSQQKKIKKRKEWVKMRNIVKNNYSKIPRRQIIEPVKNPDDITTI